jgi:hypothetical protein
MRRAAPSALVTVALLLGVPTGASAQGVMVSVVLPHAEWTFGGDPWLAPRVHRPTAETPAPFWIFVLVPVVQHTPHCVDVHVLSRLARMADAAPEVRRHLGTGIALMCDAHLMRLDRWPNGERAMTLIGSWFYPNGHRANAATGSWFYPNGERARGPNGSWYYPNGRLARTATGTWFTPERQRIGQVPHPTNIVTTVSILERIWAAFVHRV